MLAEPDVSVFKELISIILIIENNPKSLENLVHSSHLKLWATLVTILANFTIFAKYLKH